MTAYRYGRGENLLTVCGKAQPEAGTSGRVQRGLVPEPGHVGRGGGKGERDDQVQQPEGQKLQREQATKMV